MQSSINVNIKNTELTEFIWYKHTSKRSEWNC
jgi:hypothetical protein